MRPAYADLIADPEERAPSPGARIGVAGVGHRQLRM
jgi:hypothetical protein